MHIETADSDKRPFIHCRVIEWVGSVQHHLKGLQNLFLEKFTGKKEESYEQSLS